MFSRESYPDKMVFGRPDYFLDTADAKQAKINRLLTTWKTQATILIF